MSEFIVSPFCEITLVKRAYEPKVYVFGEAKNTGAFPLESGNRLLDILSSAGGPTNKAFKSSIKLVRLYGDSVGVMSINLNTIMKRGVVENNLLMQDQDVIYIPTHFLSGAAEVITTLGNLLPWYYVLKNF
jgi:polysaccharide export outer membrane protein